MNYLKGIFLAISLLLWNQILVGQIPVSINLKCAAEKSYGVDQLLLNGKEYQFYNLTAIGHPYIESKEFSLGSIELSNGVYSNLWMIFDIEKNQLVWEHHELECAEYEYLNSLKNPDPSEVESILNEYRKGTSKTFIVVEPSRVSSFNLNGRTYVCLFDGKDWKYFQQLNSGRIKMFIFWEKEYIYDSNKGKYRYRLNPHRLYLSQEEEEMALIAKKNSFIRYFSSIHQASIKKYAKRKKIKFQKASIDQLKELMDYCNSLSDD